MFMVPGRRVGAKISDKIEHDKLNNKVILQYHQQIQQ